MKVNSTIRKLSLAVFLTFAGTATLLAALAKPEVREKIQGVGIDLDVEDSATLAKTIDAEIKKWGGWVKSAGITPE